MKQLIEALQIFLKYGDVKYPTHFEHDELTLAYEYHKDNFSPEDLKALEELGFQWDDDRSTFYSFKYGSC